MEVRGGAVKSVDGLIEFLLEQIALRGSQGAIFSDVADFVTKYYHVDDIDKGVRPRSGRRPPSKPVVDQRLIEKAWTWLTERPDIVVEQKAQRDSPSQDPVERPYKQATENADHRGNSSVEPASNHGLHQLEQGDGNLNTSVSSASALVDANSSGQIPSPNVDTAGLVLYATEDRMWQAIAGHGVDPKRIQNRAFQLLSIIASCGEEGILQSQLVQVSNQDKRSLPKRTDVLHQNGYITKRKFKGKGIGATSILTLAKFSKDANTTHTSKQMRDYPNAQPDDLPPSIDASSITEDADNPTSNVHTRILPRWTPEQPLANLLHDLIDASGMQGLSTMKIHDLAAGPFCKRPVNIELQNLTDMWQLSQPEQLRHLAIVRDTAMENGRHVNFHYRTYPNFQLAVQHGEADEKTIMSALGGDASSKTLDEPPNGTPTLLSPTVPVPSDEGSFETLQDCRKAATYKRLKVPPDTFKPNLLLSSDDAQKQAMAVHQPNQRSNSTPNKRRLADIDAEDTLNSEHRRRTKLPKRKGDSPGALSMCTEKVELSPGIHINPTGRKTLSGRGRGRGLLLVFKSTRLMELEWFAQPPEVHAGLSSDKLSKTNESLPNGLEELAPGVHINPNSRMPLKQGLGRRRKRLLVVVKSNRLTELASFQAATPREQTRKRLSDVEESEAVPNSFVGQDIPTKPSRSDKKARLEQRALVACELTSAPIEPDQSTNSTSMIDSEQGQSVVQSQQQSERSNVISDLRNLETENAAEPNEQANSVEKHALTARSPPKTPSKIPKGKHTSRTRQGIPITGGTRDSRRSSLILELFRKAGGIYPGEREIWYPYVTELQNSNPEEKPDQVTIVRAVKSLVDQRKLKRLTFAFESSTGIFQKKSILVLPEISFDAPEVQQMRLNIQEAYPRTYLPTALEISPEVRKIALDARQSSQKQTTATKASGSETGPTPLSRATTTRSGRSRKKRRVSSPEGDASDDDNDESEVSEGQLRMQDEFQVSDYAHEARPRKRARKSYERQWNLDPASGSSGRQSSNRPSLPNSESMPRNATLAPPSPMILQCQSANPIEMPISKPHESNFSTKPLTQQPAPRLQKSFSINYKDVQLALNCPLQTFHSGTGTFATTFSAVTRRPRPKLRIQPNLHREFAARIPTSLDDLMSRQTAERITAPVVLSNSARINHEIDEVARWEVQHADDLTSRQELVTPHFINITAPQDESSLHLPSNGAPYVHEQPGVPKRRRRKTRLPERFREEEKTAEDAVQAVAETQGPTTRRSRASQATKQVDSSAIVKENLSLKVVKLSKSERADFVCAVLLLRCLSDTSDETVDWSIVAELCPKMKNRPLQAHWNQIQALYRPQLLDLEKRFQGKFLKAFEKGELTDTDLDDIDINGWKVIFSWAHKHLDLSLLEHHFDLPANRNLLEEAFNLEVTADVEEERVESMFEMSQPAKRESLYHELSYSAPYITRPGKLSGPGDAEALEVAKSMIKASALSPAETYDGHAARNKMLPFGERLLRQALDELLRAQLLYKKSSNPDGTSREYVPTSIYSSLSKSHLDMARHFHAAVQTKLQLDHAFALDGCQDLSDGASDTDAAVIADLLCHRRITIQAKVPPTTTDPFAQVNPAKGERLLSAWGPLRDSHRGSNSTRESMTYGVRIAPTESYVHGTPQWEELTTPPAPQLEFKEQARPSRVPLWFDIHDRPVQHLWELALASTMTALVLQPGSSAKAIARSCKGAIDEWNVSLVLDWLQKLGVARKTETNGWMAGESWWSVLGPGEKPRTAVESENNEAEGVVAANRDHLQAEV